MKKNGFTLIELLAVIIILGIILTIAITSVSGIIENSKKEAFKSSLVIASKKIKSNSYISGISTGNLQSLELNPNNLEGNWEYIQGTNDVKFLAGTYDKKSNLILNSDILLSQFNTSFNPIAVNYLDNTSSNTYASTLNNTTGLPLKNYKIYGNSTQTTSTQGKNLVDINKVSPLIVSASWSIANKKVILPTSTGNVYAGNFNKYFEDIPGQTIYLKKTVEVGSPRFLVKVYDNNKNNISSSTLSIGEGWIYNMYYLGYYKSVAEANFTMPSGANFYTVGFCAMTPTNGNTQNIYTNIMISKTDSTYEEFVPNSPSPDYPTQVVSLGENSKNLFDGNLRVGAYTFANGTFNNTESWALNYASNANMINVTPGSTISLSWKETSGISYLASTGFVFFNNNTFVESRYSAHNIISSSPTSMIVLVPPNVNKMIINLYKSGYTSLQEFQNIQVEVSNNVTEYKPSRYIDVVSSGTSSITTTIDLTGHDPLRKIGTVSDYIDYANSRIVRNIGVATFNGTETWGTDTGSGIYYHNMTLGSSQLNISSWICTHAKYNIKSGSDYTSNLSFTESGSKYLEFSSWIFATVSDFKAWLSSQSTAGTPIKIQYQLQTPTYEPIVLPPIPTLNGNTTLSIVGGGDISADYYQNK